MLFYNKNTKNAKYVRYNNKKKKTVYSMNKTQNFQNRICIRPFVEQKRSQKAIVNSKVKRRRRSKVESRNQSQTTNFVKILILTIDFLLPPYSVQFF